MRKPLPTIVYGPLILFIALALWDIAPVQARLDAPTANPATRNGVALGVVKKVAQTKATEFWGKGTLGDAIPLCNLDGELMAYMFAFHRGAAAFSHDEAMQGVKQGRELHGLIASNDLEKAREKYQALYREGPAPPRSTFVSEAEVAPRPPAADTRPDGSQPRRKGLAEVAGIEKYARALANGSIDYGTIIVSATYDTFPVLAYLDYLAPYFSSFDLAVAKAEETIGQGASLKRIYFLGVKGQFLEFANETGTVLLNAKTLQADSKEALKKSTAPAGQQPAGMPPRKVAKGQEAIAKEWQLLESEVQ